MNQVIKDITLVVGAIISTIILMMPPFLVALSLEKDWEDRTNFIIDAITIIECFFISYVIYRFCR